jgi:hypothetical protein
VLKQHVLVEEPWQESCVLVQVSGVPASVTETMVARATTLSLREGMVSVIREVAQK